jgi:TPR repeat protein
MQLGRLIGRLMLACLPLLLGAQVKLPADLRDKAVAGDAAAQFALAEAMFEGNGADLDVSGAMKWYRLSAEGKYAEAHAKLALIFRRGGRVAQDRTASRRWQVSAANLGHVSSMLILEQEYNLGIGVERDLAESAKWAKRASDAGEAKGQYLLATKYLGGWGVPKDAQEGARLCRLAANQMHLAAISHLGVLYLDGEGVPRDAAEAYRLLLIAKKFAATPAFEPRFFLEKCEALLTPTKRAEIELRAESDAQAIRKASAELHQRSK